MDERDHTMSMSSTQSPSEDSNNNIKDDNLDETQQQHPLGEDAADYCPKQYITPDIWIGRAVDMNDFWKAVVTLRQVNLTVINSVVHMNPEHPDIKCNYQIFACVRTPLTSSSAWQEAIQLAANSLPRDDDRIPHGQRENIKELIEQYCEHLSLCDPVIENQQILRSMVNFISGKYLRGDAMVHWLN